jgi:hypothetical protein
MISSLINEVQYTHWALWVIYFLSIILISFFFKKFKNYETILFFIIILGFFTGNLLLIFYIIFIINAGIVFNLDFFLKIIFLSSILWINYMTYKVINKTLFGLICLPLVIVFIVFQVLLKNENIYKISKYCKPIGDKKVQCVYEEDKYVGELKNFKRHGEGSYFWKNGDVYTGRFTNGQRDGYGILKFPNGAKYTGDFKKSLFHGSGVYIYPDGGKYEGQWQNGKKDGKGISTYANGNKIVGEFKDGKLIKKDNTQN